MTTRTRFAIILITAPVLAFAVVGGLLGKTMGGQETYPHLRVFDDVFTLTTGNYVWANWPLGSAEHTSFWKAALADLRTHLEQRGWFQKTYLEVNERSLEDTLRSVRLARSDSPRWKFTYAGKYHGELVDAIDDLRFALDAPHRLLCGRRSGDILPRRRRLLASDQVTHSD